MSDFAATIDFLGLKGLTGFRLEGEDAFDASGKSVSSAGDINGDGFDDLIVGAYVSHNYYTSHGSSYVVFGKAGGFATSINLSSLDETTGSAWTVGRRMTSAAATALQEADSGRAVSAQLASVRAGLDLRELRMITICASC